MTPKRLKYFKTKYHAIELSQGRGIYNQGIYGVSVIDITTMESCKKSVKLYQSLTSALYAIGHIQEHDKLQSNKAQPWCTMDTTDQGESTNEDKSIED